MIGFLQPWALLGLPLVGLPLLLHLMQRRDPPTVEFPAVRYLVQVTEEHQRRLKLRHWLLLLVRTLLVLAVVLAAAGPAASLARGATHAPSALVVVLDDSPSSAAVVAGTPRLTDLRAAARRVLERATPADAVWLLTSDGIARRGSPAALRARVDSLEPSRIRMDLGQALTLAGEVLATDGRPGGIVALTDLQATALSATTARVPIVVAHPAGPAPENTGVVGLDPGAQPWTPEGGAARATVGGDAATPAAVAVQLGDRPARQALVPAGTTSSFPLGPALPGWWPVTAVQGADEFRLDDRREALVRVAPVARVAWDPRDRYVDAVAGVLAASGRIRPGTELTFGALGPGASVVLPPADPAAVGALNRALERRGIGWRYAALVEAAGVTDSGALLGREAVLRRYRLEPLRAAAASGVVATVGGAPWIVRTGDVVLLGSRLEPAWTPLPLRAAFLPLVDALLNRVARGQLAVLEGAPGEPVLLPDLVTQVTQGERRWVVEGGAAFRPPATGLYFLLAGRDTVGGLAANLDPRESALAAAPAGQVRRLWPTARLLELAAAPDAAFAALGRASLAGPLLWLAFLLALAEVVLASGTRRAA
ncbi:MAG: VWA domain-containing protein [Gemmatimonadetes bacterium]|nr:VWA domain-containing protein [Gemmatimonadota bacterium]